MMLIGTLALTGFPLTAGYFSKDAIIEAAFVAHNPMALYAFVCTVGRGAADLVLFLAADLHDLPRRAARPPALRRDAHESPLVMLIPLGVLALGSIFAGLPFKEIFAGHGVEEFFRESLDLRRRPTTCSRTCTTCRCMHRHRCRP